ncbi:lipopolysaccharide kinase InaA family protein [Zooshikella sp. RANM57]|uniref:lipopolysaccharide kinase InaA family protein n=1 Tax=Zooshikella sp. RANM57 TaxID=3425863 RepID=UPI003D6FD811
MQYLCPSFATLAKQQQLVHFSDFWDLTTPWFEPPNHRRNGWSGVIEYPLTDNSGHIHRYFIKRQENHNTRSLRHPFTGEPTYRRELISILKLQALKIPTLEVVYYQERKTKGQHQAILITKALENFQSLGQWYESKPNENQISSAFQQLTAIVKQLHQHKLAHYCLYPNHIFIKPDEKNKFDIRLIDLEKVRYTPLSAKGRYKDLDCFLRHASAFSKQHLNLFLDEYFKDLSQFTHIQNKLMQQLP